MSYSSRVYRQRNPKVQEEKKGNAFFPGKESLKAKNSDSFFQAKGNTPEQGDPLKEKETNIRKKTEDEKKDIKKKSEPDEEKDQDKPMTTS